MDILTLLVIFHIIGAVLGVGGATFAEIFYVKAMQDGVIDPMEGAWMKVIYRVLRVGLVLAVLSGFGFLLLYRLTGEEEKLLDPKLWAKMTIIIVLLVNAILLTARKIPFWLGSSLSLTSWYAALILGVLHEITYSYLNIMFFYIVAVVLIAIILEFVRKKFIKKT